MGFLSDKCIHSRTQFKELSKFTDSPDLVLYVVHFSTWSTFRNPLHIFVDCIAPTRSRPSSKSMVFMSLVSVFLTPRPVPGIHSRHSNKICRNERILTGPSIRRHASRVHEGTQVILRSHSYFKGHYLNSKTCLQIEKMIVNITMKFSRDLFWGSKNI